jgi:hypothetical protein
VPDYPIILIRAGKGERTPIVMDNGVESVGMVLLAREPLKPYAIGYQEVVECSMHALEECTDIAAIVGVTERKRRMVEPSVGPTIVGCELFEVSFHGTPGRRPAMTPINILYILQPKLFRSAFRFEDITYSAAGNNFALHGIAPEDDFGVQLVCLGS